MIRVLHAVALLLAASSAVAALPFEEVEREQFAAAPGRNSLANSWADIDKDGDLDLAVSLKTGEVRLYRNDGDRFVAIGAAMGLPQADGSEIRGLSWGDYDGDGWADLLVGPGDPKKPTRVFHNDRGKGFTEVAAKLGLAMPDRSARQSSWVDYDNDGRLDLFAADRIGPNRLFHNDGDRFSPVFADGPISAFRSTVGACWFDYDEDGDLDLFLANQSGNRDALLRNDGAAGFVDVAPALGMDAAGRSKDEGGVGCAIGDYDNDGDLDIFEPNYGRNRLWRNDGGGSFTDVAARLGLVTDLHSVGAAWGDYDNDGRLDLFVTAYVGPLGQQVPKDQLFHNEGAEGFVDRLADGGPINAADHGAQFVDYDRDGGLDLSLTDFYGPVGGHPLFRNGLPAGAKRSLSVLVTDAKGRLTRAGSEVRLYDMAGHILATRLVSAGDGYNSQNAGPVIFGLATMAPVKVEVTFMGERGRKLRTIARVDPSAYRRKSLIIRGR